MNEEIPNKPTEAPFRKLIKDFSVRIPDPKWYDRYNTKYFSETEEVIQYKNDKGDWVDMPTDYEHTFKRIKKEK